MKFRKSGKTKVIRLTPQELFFAVNYILSRKGMSYAKITPKKYKSKTDAINHIYQELWTLIGEKDTEMP